MAVKYTKAPISELVCGVIFKSNFLLNNGILFKVINDLSREFPIINTHPVASEEEVVSGVIQATLDYSRAGFSTYRLFKDDSKWQVILQQNLITLHWIRQDAEKVGEYPGFQVVYSKFEEIYSLIKEATKDLNLESQIKSFYLGYTDRVNLEDYKKRGLAITDIINISAPFFEYNGIKYLSNNYYNRYSIPFERINGYSIVTVNSPTIPGIGQILVVENKLRGYSDELKEINSWFQVAHDTQVSFFENFFNKEILKNWE